MNEQEKVCMHCGHGGQLMEAAGGKWKHYAASVCIDFMRQDRREEFGDQWVTMLENECAALYDALEFYAPVSNYQFQWRDEHKGYTPEHGPNPQVWNKRKYLNEILADEGDTARKALHSGTEKSYGWSHYVLRHREDFEDVDDEDEDDVGLD